MQARSKWMIAFCLFVWVNLAWAANTVIETIQLKYRNAEQVLPMIRPLVDKEGAVTGINNQLIIRTTPRNLEQIKSILAQIDTRPRRLMITVKQNARLEDQKTGTGISGNIEIGKDGRVSVKGSKVRPNVEIRQGGSEVGLDVHSTRSISDDATTQKIQVLEGYPAFIQTGSAIPLPQQTIISNGQNTTITNSVTYQDVTTGFNVIPRIQGDQVTLEIQPRKNVLGHGGTVQIQEAATIVSGRLGEWIEIGGIGQEAHQEGAGTVYSTRSTSNKTGSILLKVEELP